MSIFSVSEDFERNTLAAIPGLWGKLLYISSLRQADGQYEHWGLMRKFGKDAAERAIGQVHEELALQTLRIPLRDLMSATAKEAAQEGTPLGDFLARLRGKKEMLFPENFGAGSGRHFTTVLQSLASLALACTDANRQAS